MELPQRVEKSVEVFNGVEGSRKRRPRHTQMATLTLYGHS
jgi:hypothetical protein